MVFNKKRFSPQLAIPLLLAAMVLTVFADVLFLSHSRVASAGNGDAANYFAAVRLFGFRELRQGHLALWNPYQFSGTPFLGNFQSALLYPPNWIYLALPLTLAMNLEIVLHLWLLGWGMSLWATRRGIHPAGALLSGTLAMFSAPIFMRVYEGHLTIIDAAAWIPFVFIAIDKLWQERPSLGVLLGSAAAALQLLAGHPQTVFITVIAAGGYALVQCADKGKEWKRVLWMPVFMFIATALAAAQLGASLDAAAESTRRGPVTLAFASSYGLSHINLVTLFVPGFFGGTHRLPYWGYWNAWEEGIFMGVFGLSLAIYGAFCAQHALRRRVAALAVLMYVLALAPYTPLFPVLYHFVPGFDELRAACRFALPGMLFLSLLAGMGLDALLKRPVRLKTASMFAVVGSVLIGCMALLIAHQADVPGGKWASLVHTMARQGDMNLMPNLAQTPQFIRKTAIFAATDCAHSAFLLLVLGVLLWAARNYRKAVWGILAVALFEIFTFALSARTSFDIRVLNRPGERLYLAAHPSDERIWQTDAPPNFGSEVGVSDIWGYDPFQMYHYTSFMAWTQGQYPLANGTSLGLSHSSPLFRLLRLQLVFGPSSPTHNQAATLTGALPHVLLVSHWQQVQGQSGAFAAMGQPSFRPSKTVLLEKAPNPLPVPGRDSGTAEVTASTPDTLTIRADALKPCLLLVTDCYARGWKAVALPGSVQKQYDVLRADDILRAIPLAQGNHSLRLVYDPSGFKWGSIISLITLGLYLALASAEWARGRIGRSKGSSSESLTDDFTADRGSRRPSCPAIFNNTSEGKGRAGGRSKPSEP